MRSPVRRAAAIAAVSTFVLFFAGSAMAQDSAGCRKDFASLSDDDLLWGKPVQDYCPYGYGPGMPYGARAAPPRAERGRAAEFRREGVRQRRAYE